MKKKLFIIVVVFALCFLFGFIGCAPDEGQEAPAVDVDEPDLTIEDDKELTPLEGIEQKAKEEGFLRWYGSDDPVLAQQIIDKFNQSYPEIEIEYTRLHGAEVTTRILTEADGGVTSGDLAIVAPATIEPLREAGLLEEVDWRKLGVEEERLWGDFLPITTAVREIVFNTNMVDPDEVPTTFEEVLDPKWKGEFGVWIQPFDIAMLPVIWGEEKTIEYAEAFRDNDPIPYRSTADLVTAIAAGEISLGNCTARGQKDLLEAGAPIDVVLIDPNPTGVLPVWITKAGDNPNAAKIFALWLASDESVLFYEELTRRGNIFNPNCEISKRIEEQGVEVIMWGPDDADLEMEWRQRIAEILEFN